MKYKKILYPWREWHSLSDYGKVMSVLNLAGSEKVSERPSYGYLLSFIIAMAGAITDEEIKVITLQRQLDEEIAKRERLQTHALWALVIMGLLAAVALLGWVT